MTETKMSVRQLSGEANLVGNRPLEELMQVNLERLGAPRFDEEDRAFARKIQATVSKESIRSAYERHGLQPRSDEVLSETLIPLDSQMEANNASTDVGSVSWVVPTVQCRVACYAIGTPGHSWQLVSQGRAPAAHKGLAVAAKAMAATATDLLSNPSLIAAAKTAFSEFRRKNEFKNPVDGDVEPPFDMAAH